MRRLLVAVMLSACGGDDTAAIDGGPAGDGATGDACVQEETCGDSIDNDCDGEVDEDCAQIGAYVSAEIGDDSNAGTIDAPVKTIGRGIANAQQLGGDRAVIVGEGTYAEKVTLVDGIDLIGGHQCSEKACDFARDIALYASTIENVDLEGVLAGPGVTPSTLLSGFTVTGLSGAPTAPSGTAAVTLAGGSPTLRGNRIVGGDAMTASETNSRAIGLAVRGATDALIENNEISSGTGAQSIALAIEGAPASVAITGNAIRSGTGRRSIALFAQTAQGSTIVGNDLTSGSSTGGASVGLFIGSNVTVSRNRINLDRVATGTCTQTTTWCSAITIEGATTTLVNNIAAAPKGNRTAGLVLAELERPAGTVTVANNYINGGGSGPQQGGGRNVSAGVVLQISSAPMLTGTVGRISNNIVHAGINADRYGIREEAAQNREIHPALVSANIFYFSTANNRDDIVYREIGDSGFPIDYRSLFLFENNGPVLALDNLDDNPLLDTTTWRLSANSPCIDVGVTTDAPATDFEGDPRPQGQGIDIGHDEF